MPRLAHRDSAPATPRRPRRAVGRFARWAAGLLGVWVWVGPSLTVSVSTPTLAVEAPGGASLTAALALTWPEARAQVSAVSALWREIDALRTRWRVDATTLRIDVDRFRERVARRRWQLRRQKGGTGEP
jgi:hypothetical protein